ncbi:putative transcription factor B3-Domain family [Helianthus debilis subsp. tardiflorus]
MLLLYQLQSFIVCCFCFPSLSFVSDNDILVFTNLFFLNSFRQPCFCRHMNKADKVILSIPSDAACKLWGADKAPINVMIHTDDGRIFNVCLSENKGNLFFFLGWSNVTQHLRLSKGCLVVFNPLDCTTFKVTYFLDDVSGSFFGHICYVHHLIFMSFLNLSCRKPLLHPLM